MPGNRCVPPIDSIRRTEAGRLTAALDTLDRGRAQIIEVVGEPGMGKTCLLAGLAEAATARGLTVLSNRCTASRRNALFRSLARLLCSDSPSGGLDRLPAELRGPVTEVMGGPSVWQEVGNPAHRTLLNHAVHEFLGTFAHDGMVVLIDDFHWADDGSVEMIEQLVHRPVNAPLLVVIGQRPRQASTRLRGTLAHGVELGVVERVELRPLTLEQSAGLISLPVDDPRLVGLHQESQGVPLYLLALAGARSDGEIPEQLATLVLDEIGQLGPCETLIAGAAAVLDEEWDLETLSAVAEVDLDRTRTALIQLTQRDLLRPVGLGSSFTFRHSVVRELVSAHTGRAWQVAAHRRALDFLSGRGAPPRRLAGHVERSLAGPNPDDLSILRHAAEDALQSDPAAAVHWLQVALGILPVYDGQERVETMLLLTRALGQAGRLRESRDLLHEVLRLLPSGSRSVRSATIAFCALVECLLGNYAEARALLVAELTALSADDPPREATALIIEHGLIGAIDGRVPACDQVNLAKRLARIHDDAVAETGALALSGLCDAFNEDIEGAAEVLSESAELADRLSDSDLATHPEYLGVLGWAEGLIGRVGDAQRHFQRGIEIARKCGHVHILSVLLAGQAAALLHNARPGAARRAAGEARELAERINADHVRGLALSLEAQSAAWAGDGRAAISLGEQAEEILHRRRFHWSVSAPIALAAAARLGGNPRRCLMLLLDAGGSELQGIPANLRPAGFETLTAAVMAITAAGGEPPVAAKQVAGWADLAEEAAAATDLPMQLAYAHAARGHALYVQGDPLEALPYYRRAARLFSSAGMIHTQALTLTAEAAAMAAAGRPDEAETTLLLAGELARRSGAAIVELRVEDRWRRPAQPVKTPPVAQRLSVLTTREREIAEIAGRGKRTREIAEELSVSPRTVDVHLTRIYRKLEITSRTALARLMAGAG